MELKLLKGMRRGKFFRIFFSLSIIFMWNINYSQYQPILAPPKIPESIAISTPDVMSFQKYGNVPISLYNGKINMVIPFYEIQSGKINIPINLTYNSGGIKVDEIASQVGLGWNLNAGGNILVNVNDLPDGALTTNNYGTLINIPINVGYWRRYFLSNPVFNNNMRWFANVDSKPDFYHVNAPGLNNIFTIDDTNYNDYQSARSYIASFLYPKGHKIESIIGENLGSFQGIGFNGNEDGNPNLDLPTKPADVNFVAFFDFKKFEIKNEQGLVYKFSPGNIIESRTLPVLVDPTNIRLDPSYKLNINTYNLTSILDPSTKKIVEFTYETYQITHAQRIKFLSKGNNVSSNDGCNYKFIPEFEGQPIYSNEKLIKYHTATRLKKIKFDAGEVEFTYSNDRQDYDDKSLDYIKIKDLNGNTIKNFHLNYSYFDSKENCYQKECMRLKLDQIDEEYPTSTKMYYKFEYDYVNKLPKRFSYEQDFLGYYNNNGYINESFIGSDVSGPQPKLFFYPNKGPYSILPFNKTNDSNGREIAGDYSFAPNNFSLTGLLKKVTYETKGTTEFEYENNSFNFDGAQYMLGGTRIKKQKINNDNGIIRELEYQYVETDGKTSGYINSLPTFAYPNAQISNLNALPSQWTPFSFTTYDFDKSGLELTNNFIGYSRVIEREIGNGSTESLFNSANDYPDIKPQRQHRDICGKYLLDHSNFPGKLFENVNGRRGTLKQKIIRDEVGNILNKTENTYTYQVFSSINTVYYEPYKITDNEFYPRINQYNAYVEELSKINRERNLMTKETITDYKTIGNMVTDKFYTYSPIYPFIKEERILDNVNEFKFKNVYSFDLSPVQPLIGNLLSQNQLSEPHEIEGWKNSVLVSKIKTNFKSFTNNNILPESITTSKGNSNLEETMIIDSRDDNGNITQYHKTLGANTSLIYGYNKTKPIVKVENASFTQIQGYESNLQLLSNADNDRTLGNLGQEGALRNALNNLRIALPNAMITTFTYDPLFGITSVTDFKGDVQYYNYDDFGRLKSVKDKNGNILSQNQYHYKN